MPVVLWPPSHRRPGRALKEAAPSPSRPGPSATGPSRSSARWPDRRVPTPGRWRSKPRYVPVSEPATSTLPSGRSAAGPHRVVAMEPVSVHVPVAGSKILRAGDMVAPRPPLLSDSSDGIHPRPAPDRREDAPPRARRVVSHPAGGEPAGFDRVVELGAVERRSAPVVGRERVAPGHQDAPVRKERHAVPGRGSSRGAVSVQVPTVPVGPVKRGRRRRARPPPPPRNTPALESGCPTMS